MCVFGRSSYELALDMSTFICIAICLLWLVGMSIGYIIAVFVMLVVGMSTSNIHCNVCAVGCRYANKLHMQHTAICVSGRSLDV
jgi:hypothetical protein